MRKGKMVKSSFFTRTHPRLLAAHDPPLCAAEQCVPASGDAAGRPIGGWHRAPSCPGPGGSPRQNVGGIATPGPGAAYAKYKPCVPACTTAPARPQPKATLVRTALDRALSLPRSAAEAEALGARRNGKPPPWGSTGVQPACVPTSTHSLPRVRRREEWLHPSGNRGLKGPSLYGMCLHRQKTTRLCEQTSLSTSVSTHPVDPVQTGPTTGIRTQGWENRGVSVGAGHRECIMQNASLV